MPAAYVARERLDRLWSGEWREKSLVLVTAGAGTGKTSFLAAGARGAGRPRIWYSLEESDADLATFCAYLQRAVCGAAPADRAQGSAEELSARVLAAVVRSLGAEGGERVLILDDVHLVAGSPEVLSLIERLVRFVPCGTTLVLSSREELGLGTVKLRSQGVLASLSTADLAFDAEEVGALLAARLDGARLPPDLAPRVVAETEGWGAGIEILFQALESEPNLTVEQALGRLRRAGEGWFPFFAEEVLERLDPGTRSFLLESSILPRLEVRTCDEVLQIANSGEILESLSRRNLFTYPLSSERSAFRYHHLFRDFLRDRLARDASPEEIASLQRRAAVVLVAQGLPAEAAAAFALAGDFEAALGVFEHSGEALVATGKYALILRALEALPAERLAEHSGALYTLGRIHDIQGRWDAAEAVYRQALERCATPAVRVELMSLIAQQEMRKGNYDACLELCERALAEPGRLSSAVRGRILGLQGVSACDLGRLDEGEIHLQAAGKVYRRGRDPLGEGRVLFLLAANVHFPRGQFSRARRAARRHIEHALASVRATRCRGIEADCLLLLGSVVVEAEPEHALEHWRAAEELMRAVGADFELSRLQLIRLDHESLDAKRRRERATELVVRVAGLEHEMLFTELETERAARVLPAALALGVEPEYVTDLLRRLGPAAVPGLVPLATSPEQDLRLRAVELLAHIGGEQAQAALARASDAGTEAGRPAGRAAEELGREAPAQLVIRALGPFELELGERLLTFADWKSRRALRLLQLLLVRRFEWVPQGEILEALWPETDPEKSTNSLRQTIHLLRKTLEPDLEQLKHSFFVRYRNEACRLVPGSGSRYGVLEFEGLLDAAARALRAEDAPAAETHLRAAVELYRGDFLAESPYEEFTTVEREELRTDLTRGLARLLDILDAAERWDSMPPLCRRGLALDSCDERLHWHLVHAHLQLGNRREALEDFHAYETMMIRELELLPSARMKTLADRVLVLGAQASPGRATEQSPAAWCAPAGGS